MHNAWGARWKDGEDGEDGDDGEDGEGQRLRALLSLSVFSVFSVLSVLSALLPSPRASDHFRRAQAPELPALLPRSVRLALRHLDPDGGAGMARAPVDRLGLR